LVTSILNGNLDSFSILVSKYENRLFNFLLRLTSSREDSEEILQETFIRVYSYLYRYDSKWQFSTWIYSIAVNSFKDFYKKKKRRHTEYYDYSSDYLQDSFTPIEDTYETKELYDKVVKLINGLKEDQRTALILKCIQGFSYNEIAKILDISPDNARMKVFRARQSISDGLLENLKRGVKK
jgi:RNA polymerase sigma-70 factor (ECF subfamily)